MTWDLGDHIRVSVEHALDVLRLCIEELKSQVSPILPIDNVPSGFGERIYDCISAKVNLARRLAVSKKLGSDRRWQREKSARVTDVTYDLDRIVNSLDREWLCQALREQAEIEMRGAQLFLEDLVNYWKKIGLAEPDEYRRVIDGDWEYWGRIVWSRDTVENVMKELRRLGVPQRALKRTTKQFDDMLRLWGPVVFRPLIENGSLAREGMCRAAPKSYWWYYLTQR